MTIAYCTLLLTFLSLVWTHPRFAQVHPDLQDGQWGGKFKPPLCLPDSDHLWSLTALEDAPTCRASISCLPELRAG